MKGKYFLKDTALNHKNNDAFHHQDYVDNIKKIIEEHTPPFNIALIGKWGVGKSSIINLLKNEFKGREEYKTHEINAWKYENESLRKAFLKNLWKTFNNEQDVTVINRITNALKQVLVQVTHNDEKVSVKAAVNSMLPYLWSLTIIWTISCILFLVLFIFADLITTLFVKENLNFELYKSITYFKSKIWIPLAISPFFVLFMNFINSNLFKKTTAIQMMRPIETPDEYEELFKKEIKQYKVDNPDFKKLIVIIDDLDRLSPKKVVNALDAIKAFVDVEECIFIVCCDEEILKKALEKNRFTNNFDDIDEELFLDKLFQFRIPLPPIIESDMKEYSRNLAAEEVPDLVTLCNGKFDEIINILIHPEVTTPRQVKKILNTFANNLLIAKNREGRKLENELLTGDEGIKVLAKLSVLQSDYSSIYNELINNSKILEDLLERYNGNEDANEKIDKFYNKKTNKIRQEYDGLINFLLRTQHISSENLGPFLYLGQGTVGLLAGDAKEKKIRKDLLSGNEKEIISILETSEDAETIALAILEQIKYTAVEDLGYTLKASYQVIDYIPDTLKRELSNTISFRIQEIPINGARLHQVNYENLLNVFLASDNKVGAKKALLYVMNTLFQNKKWKTISNRDMEEDDFVTNSYELINQILKKVKEVNDNEITDLVKKFIALQNANYEFFPFERIHNLFINHEGLFEEFFGLSFYHQLTEYISQHNKSKEYIKEVENTFLLIASTISRNFNEDFLESLPKVLNVSKSLTNQIINIITAVENDISQEQSIEILKSIIQLDYTQEDDTLKLVDFLYNLQLDLTQVEDEFLTDFDSFIYNILPDEAPESIETMNNINKLINSIVSKLDKGFGILPESFKYIQGKIMDESYFDEVIDYNGEFFTAEQRNSVFTEINKGIAFANINNSLFRRSYNLYSILVKDEENESIIKNYLPTQISYFLNNSFVSYTAWASNFITLLGITKKLVDKSLLNSLATHLLNHNYPDLMIKCFKYFGDYLPDELLAQSVTIIIDKTTNDVDKLDALEYFRNIKSKHINKENNNLTPYAKFLVENLEVNSELFVKDLHWFAALGNTTRYITFIKKISELEKEELKINADIYKRTSTKLFKGFTPKTQNEVIASLIEDIDVEFLNEYLISELTNRKELLEVQIKSKELKENSIEFKLKLLDLIGRYKEEYQINLIAELFIEVLNSLEQEEINDFYKISLKHFSNYRFNHTKKLVFAQILRVFKKVNYESKSRLLQLAKNFEMNKDFKSARKNVTDEESEFIKNELKLRG
ncbi:KAP family P-loop NTPase fold protein [Fictibacillus sp. 26RED30]|uniref:KAP family P-loop NTPase fold protein n=1 Tax=Fictibacillus sp. 26RED30 TaxID=2745877 RepID=UPI0018CF77C9|nr:P-loop NTPase fold protein [Fictibacillus sp. 26RED30]MBH0162071.1 hypothetical protein [Fictibacillus sp. 26RED30]